MDSSILSFIFRLKLSHGRIELLEARIEELLAQLGKNSSNSDKPPSSDSPFREKRLHLPRRLLENITRGLVRHSWNRHRRTSSFLIKLYRTKKNAGGKLVRHLERELGSLWTFLEENGVDATNNLAERTLRFAVTWRKRSFGSRNDNGERFVERMLSLRQTCRLRGLRTWPILVDAYAAFLSKVRPELLSQIA